MSLAASGLAWGWARLTFSPYMTADTFWLGVVFIVCGIAAIAWIMRQRDIGRMAIPFFLMLALIFASWCDRIMSPSYSW